jgi:small-conductance mechanosensitive channel
MHGYHSPMPRAHQSDGTSHRRRHRLADAAPTQLALGVAHRRDFRLAVSAAIGALAALVCGSTLGDVHARTLHARLIAFGAALAFVVLGAVAARRLAASVAAAAVLRAGRTASTALRLVITLCGYVVVALVALGLLAVPVQHLLLGGAVTGVVVGIAAQQSLGNMFAGMVLIVTRPFSVGDRIRIRAGALGGEFDGVVRTMSLTYVTVDTDDGPLHVPNSGVLAAAVGPRQRQAGVLTPVSGVGIAATHAEPRRAGDGHRPPWRR